MAFAVVVALVDAWGSRYNLNPDGVSYVELARHAITSGPRGLINGLWSPGYPSLLMWPLELATARADALIPALHVVNLLLYLMSLALFLQLMRAAGRPATNSLLARSATGFGAVVFAAIAIRSIGLGLITPDFGVLLAVLATAACCFQLERSEQGWAWAVLLGGVLGLGYWMKGILLPLGGLLLALLLCVPPRIDRARTKIAVAALMFGVVCLPLATLVSARVGRPTVGEVGRLNYAWQIDRVTPYVGWLGDSTGRYGRPVHPPRVIQADPLTLEFATPIQATYPLWFDPAYWYAGVRPRFDLRGQWLAFRQGLSELGPALLDQWLLVAAMLAIGLATMARRGGGARRERIPLVLALWSAGSVLVYTLVHVEPRYLAGFFATGVVAAWSGLSARAPRARLPVVVGVAGGVLALSLFWYLAVNLGGLDPSYRPDYLLDAARIRESGVQSGDRVGAIGDAFEQYPAFVGGTPIAAQVIDSAGYWDLSPAQRSALDEKLARAGIRALLANNVDPGATAEGWRIMVHADSSNLGLLLLAAPGTGAPP